MRKPLPTKPHKKSHYEKCECDGYWFPHRMSGGSCKFTKTGAYKYVPDNEVSKPCERDDMYYGF